MKARTKIESKKDKETKPVVINGDAATIAPTSLLEQQSESAPGKKGSPRGIDELVGAAGLQKDKIEGFLRLSEIIAPYGPIPIGKSSWWAGVRDGRFPQPIKISRRVTAWHVDDVRDLIQRLRGSHG